MYQITPHIFIYPRRLYLAGSVVFDLESRLPWDSYILTETHG